MNLDTLSIAARTPSPQEVREAVRIYIENAYGPTPPARALQYLPPDGPFDVNAWLADDRAERTPPGAPIEQVRSFALRIGSAGYRHMKLRISRPGNRPLFVFTVDAHDSFLGVEPGSPDYEGIQALQAANAVVVSRITAAWEAAGLETERSLLRRAILNAKGRK